MVYLRAYLQLSLTKSGKDEEGVHGDSIGAGDRLQKVAFLAEFKGQALSANGTNDTIMHTSFHPSRTPPFLPRLLMHYINHAITPIHTFTIAPLVQVT